MSIIAIRWAYSRPIKNPVEKNILVFICTHDFPGNKSFFKIQTICDATAYGRTAVKTSLKRLVETGYLRKCERFDADGKQLSNICEPIIDDEFVEEFCKYYDLSTGGGREATPPQSAGDPSPGREATTYKNNNIKNNIKKSSYNAKDQKASNEKKHGWAEPRSNANQPQSVAGVLSQSTSFNNITEHRQADISPLLHYALAKGK